MNFPPAIATLVQRPAAVLGYGVSGQAAAALLRRRGAGVEAYDERPGEGVRGKFGPIEAKRHDLVVHSPGFAQDHPWLQTARAAGATLLGEMDFASLFWPGEIICVTGTNGKTTLTEFLATALRRTGRAAHAAGNIGHPLSRLDELGAAPDEIAVCETSSFQAEGLKHLRPHALLWTNFDEDHLDRHPAMRDYFDAKCNLVRRLARPRFIVGESVARAAVEFGFKLPPYAVIVKVAGSEKFIPEGTVFSHRAQAENYLIARKFWELEGLPMAALEETARTFATRRHRLARVADVEGVEFWNDSKGTNFHAALAALESLRGPVVWIGGGKSKGGDLDAFTGRVAGRVREALLIGETAGPLVAGLHARGVPATACETLPEAVSLAFTAARASGPATVLFSPGFASFDMFANYAERGLVFEKAVLSLKAAPIPLMAEPSPA